MTTIAGSNSGLSVVIDWPLPYDNGSPLTGCQVEFKKQGHRRSKTFNTGVVGTKTILSVRKGAYEFRVRCENAAGFGMWSAWGLDSRTDLVPNRTYFQPVYTKSTSTISVVWNVPNDNGSPITAYQILLRSLSGPTNRRIDVAAGMVSTEISGLTHGTRYNIRVRAQNGNGWGRFGDRIVFVTD